MSLLFEACSSIVRLVSCISLSFWSRFYLIFSDAIHSFSGSINHLLCLYISVYMSFGSPLYIIFMSIYPYLLFETQIRMRVVDIAVREEAFEKFLYTKLFLVKFQTFSFQVFTFQTILPGILIPNLQTRHFLWYVIKKTLTFCKGRNSSRRYVYANLQAAFQNVLQNRRS